MAWCDEYAHGWERERVLNKYPTLKKKAKDDLTIVLAKKWTLQVANAHMREWAWERRFETDTRVGQSMVNVKNTI